MVKKLPANEGDMGLIHGLGRSAGGGHGNPLQYSSLENPWTREPGGLQSMGLGKSWTQLSDQTTTQLHYKVIITYHKYIYIPVILLQIRLNQRSEKYKIVLLYL